MSAAVSRLALALALFGASNACRNVPTGGSSGAAGEAVSESPGAANLPPPGSLGDASNHGTNATSPGASVSNLSDEGIQAAPDAPATESAGRAKALVVSAEELARAACQVWLDDPYSDVVTTDIEVRYRATETTAEADLVLVPPVPEMACSQARVGRRDGGATGATDGGAAASSDGGSLHDATPSLDAGVRGDAGVPTSDADDVVWVDLSTEGWFLTETATGLWFEVCVNACATIAATGGSLLLEVPYAVQPPAAR